MARDTRKCIKDFIQHVEKLEAEEDPDGNGFNAEYRRIHEVQVENRRKNVFQMTAGKAENNLKKNRYKDILPYDDHRVLLSEIEGEENSDYINASKLMGVKGTGGYIASQGPLASTVNDYWRMIWESNVKIIFMACKIVELGKIKCKQYWNDVEKSDQFGDITVYTEAEKEISNDFIRRDFVVTRNGEERCITQFHYLGWPDHGIPDDPAHIKDLIKITRQARRNDQAPLLVHCSAGCGRTGAIVAIDFVWTLLDQGRFDETFDLYQLICNFREQRMSMVQTADQYALVNKVLRTLCEEWLEKMASHTYENVDLKDQDTPAKDEDSIYENAKTMESKTSSGSSGKETNPTEKRPGGPEIIELPPPSYQAPKPPKATSPSRYENVVIMPDNSLVIKDPVDTANTEVSSKPATLHKTVIQLGDHPPAPATAQSTSGTKEVINFVRGGSLRSSTSSTGSASTPCPTSPPAPTKATEATGPGLPAQIVPTQEPAPQPSAISKAKTLPAPSRNQSAGAAINSQRSKSQRQYKYAAGGDEYSLVYMPGAGGAAHTGGSSRDRSTRSVKETAHNVTPANTATHSPVRDTTPSVASATDPTYSDMQLVVNGNSDGAGQRMSPPTRVSSSSNSSSGFGVRLPRVKGPEPAPAAWGAHK